MEAVLSLLYYVRGFVSVTVPVKVIHRMGDVTLPRILDALVQRELDIGIVGSIPLLIGCVSATRI